MEINSKIQLNSIRKRLLIMLVFASTVISIVLAAAVLFIDLQRIGRLVNDRANQISQSFNGQVRHMLDPLNPDYPAPLQNELKMLLIAGKFKQGMGQLVYASIFDQAGKEIVTEKDTDYGEIETVEALVEPGEKRLPRRFENIHKFKHVDGKSYILLSFPLSNSSGERVAFIDGIFAVSSVARGEIVTRIKWSVLESISIVLLTTFILYPIIIALIKQLSHRNDDLLEANIEILRVIGNAIAKRDSETDSHNYRVTIYSVTLAEALKLDKRLIRGLIKGAFLHDVGKIGISDKILLKPGKLTSDEFKAMQLHVKHGMDIVKNSKWLKNAIAVVSSHHEKFSGGGYPKGLIGEKIHINARIFAIADVFDALTSKRPYKKAMSYEEAMDILQQGRGSHFDPFLLDTFKEISRLQYDKFANCSEVSLHEKLENITRYYFAKEQVIKIRFLDT